MTPEWRQALDAYDEAKRRWSRYLNIERAHGHWQPRSTRSSAGWEVQPGTLPLTGSTCEADAVPLQTALTATLNAVKQAEVAAKSGSKPSDKRRPGEDLRAQEDHSSPARSPKGRP
jgi:hypothetical protein